MVIFKKIFRYLQLLILFSRVNLVQMALHALKIAKPCPMPIEKILYGTFFSLVLSILVVMHYAGSGKLVNSKADFNTRYFLCRLLVILLLAYYSAATRAVTTFGAADAMHRGPSTKRPCIATFYCRIFSLKALVNLLLFIVTLHQ